MGTCGKKSVMTKSISDIENEDKNETQKIEQSIIEIKDNKNKGIESKESKTLKKEETEPNIDLRKNQTQSYDSKKEKDITEINIIYNINYETEINIFGYNFVVNNKNNCKMIIDNKEYEINVKCNVKNNNKNILKIKLKGINNIIDMSDMFNGCSSLLSLPDISKWNTNNVTNMSGMFKECSSLLSLPDTSKWITNNTIDMSDMFNGCSSLSSLPDISKWNTNKVKNMRDILSGCSSLLSFDI